MKGIGIDVVNVKKLSDKVAHKILSKKELAEFNSYLKDNKKRAMEFLGGRLAGKEAYLKAIGVSTYEGISLPDIAIYKNVHGEPKFKGAPKAHLSISHDGNLAIAIVVIE